MSGYMSIDRTRGMVARRSCKWLAPVMAVAGSLALLGGAALPANAMFGPAAIAVSPDGQRIYVSLIAEDTIPVFSTTNYQAVGSVRVQPSVESSPSAAAVSPDGTRVYFTRFPDLHAGKEEGSLLVIDSAANKVAATVPVGLWPSAVVVTPDGKRVYVASAVSGTVSVIDTASNRVAETLAVGIAISGLAISPDGTRLYAAGTGGSDRNPGMSTETGSVSVIDTATRRVVAKVIVDAYPGKTAVSPDGKRLYVTHYGGSLSVIDTATNTVAAVMKEAGSLAAIAVSPDSKRVYVLQHSYPRSRILAIDTAASRIIASVDIRGFPTTLVLSPDGARAYVGLLDTRTFWVIDTASGQVIAAPQL